MTTESGYSTNYYPQVCREFRFQCTLKNHWNTNLPYRFLAFIGLGLSAGLPPGVAWSDMQEEFNLALDTVTVLLLVHVYTLASFIIG